MSKYLIQGFLEKAAIRPSFGKDRTSVFRNELRQTIARPEQSYGEGTSSPIRRELNELLGNSYKKNDQDWWSQPIPESWKSSLTKPYPTEKSIVSRVGETLGDTFSQVRNKVSDWERPNFPSMPSIEEPMQTFKNLPGEMGNVLGDYASGIKDIGSRVGQSFSDSLSGAYNKIKGWF